MSGSAAFVPSEGTCVAAIVIIGTIISPTPLPKPLFVTPMRNTPRKISTHQTNMGGHGTGATQRSRRAQRSQKRQATDLNFFLCGLCDLCDLCVFPDSPVQRSAPGIAQIVESDRILAVAAELE